jgi:hypothetical protein
LPSPRECGKLNVLAATRRRTLSALLRRSPARAQRDYKGAPDPATCAHPGPAQVRARRNAAVRPSAVRGTTLSGRRLDRRCTPVVGFSVCRDADGSVPIASINEVGKPLQPVTSSASREARYPKVCGAITRRAARQRKLRLSGCPSPAQKARPENGACDRA